MNKLEEFLKFEKDNNLFDYKCKNVYFWSLVRRYIYISYILNKKNIHPDLMIKSKDRKPLIIKKIPKQIIYRLSIRKKDIFSAEHNIYRLKDGREYSPYVDFLKELKYTTHHHTTYHPSRGKNILYKGTNDSVLSLKLFLFFKMLKFYNKPKIKPIKGIDEIRKVVDMINKNFNLTIEESYINDIVGDIYFFLFRKKFYIKLIKNRFKVILIEDHYNTNHMALCQASHECGIPCVELQHGVIGKHHVSYNFIDTSSNGKYLPDYIFTFGDYWSKTMRVPDGVTPISTGFPLIEQSIHDLAHVEKNNNQVVFYSQGTVGKELSDLAVKFADLAVSDGYEIKYKLHPSECKTWTTIYPHLINENIEVIDSTMNVHELLASAKYHIGVNSTVLYEAIAFENLVFVYNMNGHDVMDDLIEQELVSTFNDEKELLYSIKNTKTNLDLKAMKNKLFKENSIRNIENELTKIINKRENEEK